MGRVVVVVVVVKLPDNFTTVFPKNKRVRERTHTHTQRERERQRERESGANQKTSVCCVLLSFVPTRKKVLSRAWVVTRPSRELQRILWHLGFRNPFPSRHFLKNETSYKNGARARRESTLSNNIIDAREANDDDDALFFCFFIHV